MLKEISWSGYITAVVVLFFIWYGFLVFRYFPKNWKAVFKDGLGRRFSARKTAGASGPFSEYKESFDTLKDAEQLYGKLSAVFAEGNDRGLSKTGCRHYIQFVLSDYPFVKQSSLREKINSLMVLESRKYPSFLLTEKEMDSLWESEL